MDESDAEREVDAALDEEEKRRKQADILIEIGRTAELFRTPAPNRDAYADITIDGHRETWRLRSKGFRSWLRHQYFQLAKAGCSSESMQVAIETLVSFALFDKEAEEREVHIRVAGHEGAIYIDVGDPLWHVIEVTELGWKVISGEDSPVRFRRTPSMRPLPLPEKGGSIKELRKLVNVGSDNDFVLLVAYAMAALRPDNNYPVLGVAGVQGSGKSSLIRLLQRLIDPRMPTMRSIPREEDDLIVGAKGAHFLGFDNVSRLSDEMSDAICRLSTGGGSGKRQLYTDDDEVLFSGRRPVAFNGIEDVATRPDMVERTILLWLTRPKKRQRETEINAAFEKVASGIFGALLDGLVSGLGSVGSVSDEDLPRMADFAVWAEACCRAYWKCGTFLKAYKSNLTQAVDVVLDASPVATAVRTLMVERLEWKGTATELLEVLTNIVGEKAAKEREWPKRPNTLANRLRRVIPDLAKVGIIVMDERVGHDRTRLFTITLSEPVPDSPDPEHTGKTSSASSASSATEKNQGLNAGDLREMGSSACDDGSSAPERRTGADDRKDDQNSQIVRDNPLKGNGMDDADDEDDLFPTHSGSSAAEGLNGSARPHAAPAGNTIATPVDATAKHSVDEETADPESPPQYNQTVRRVL
jgi:hypothetical protein